MVKITVFTATYNRAYILTNAYESLCTQTDKSFEWIIVDDGSTDETESLVNQWINKNNGFEIRYYKVPNGGKMRAANFAYKSAKGELFLNLDSDDYITEDCIEKVIKWENTIADQKDKFAGIAVLKCDFDGKIIGTTFSGEYLDASCLDRGKFNISGDRAEIFYTDLLRKYPFQEFSGEKFIAEGIVWQMICYHENKILRWVNEPLYRCEYREDGYSHHALKLAYENPQGVAYNINKTIEMISPEYIGKLKLWHKYYLVAIRL